MNVRVGTTDTAESDYMRIGLSTHGPRGGCERLERTFEKEIIVAAFRDGYLPDVEFVGLDARTGMTSLIR